MKKVLVVALCALLTLSLFIPVMAEDGPKFTTTVSANRVKRGDTVTVTVSADKVFAAKAIALDFASVCDPAAFELVEAYWTTDKISLADVDTAQFKAVGFCVNLGSTPETAQPATGISGEIFKITVKAKADAAYDDYNFKVAVTVDQAAATSTGTTVKVSYVDLNGWVYEGGIWYYYESGTKVTNAWHKDSIGWCFLTADGSMAVKTFVKDSIGWAYVDEGGYFYEITAWRLLDGKWYYVENGYRVENTWRKDSKGWCYLTGDGSMMTNDWLKDSVGWCYIGADGYCLANGTYTIGGYEYYFDENGRIEGEPIR